MNFKQFIEAIQKEVPDKFYLIAKLRGISELAKTGQLKGVQGISSSVGIIDEFLFSDKIMLAMRGSEVVARNSLSRVMYDNPHYLTSKNLSVYHRLSDTRSAPSRAWGSLIYNVLHDVTPILEKETGVNRELLTALIDLKRGINDKTIKLPDTNIRNGNDFANRFIGLLRLHYGRIMSKIRLEMIEFLRKSLIAGVANDASSLASEEEWLVKDKVLKVPVGSILIIIGNPNYYLTEADIDSLYRRYRVHFLEGRLAGREAGLLAQARNILKTNNF